jgi:hypothetical protein
MARLISFPTLRPMRTFDPTKPAMMHDQLNDRTFQWDPERWGDDFWVVSRFESEGMIDWDGLLLDGWKPIT